jgi:tetratricopeptide (TPR) repeat protein
MPHHKHALNAWRLSVITVIFLCGGAFQFAIGQNWDLKIGDSRTNSSPNPRVNLKRSIASRSNKRNDKVSAKEEKLRSIEQAIEDGNKARDANDYDQAWAKYVNAKELNPQEPRAYYGLGNLYADFVCNDLSIDAYLKALKLDPEYLDALVGLGNAYANEEQYDKAEAQFRHARLAIG